MSIGRAAEGVLNGAAKLAFFVILTAAAFGGDAAETKAVLKKNQ
jgi:hypothetical protein